MIVALAQVNPLVGDLDGNVALMRRWIDDARGAGAQLVLFPELTVSGYPPEDLLLRFDFLERCREAVEDVAAAARGIVVAFGAPLHGPRDLHNALVLAGDGRVQAVYHKRHLPTYGVFDEGRYFGPGAGEALVEVGGHLIGLSVCADLWVADGPATRAARAGAALVLNASASPFHAGKGDEREAMLFQRARDLVAPIAYVNQWGGQDELVFDGGSMVVDHRGGLVARAEQFADELVVCPLDLRAVRGARLRDPRMRASGSLDPVGPSGEPQVSALARVAVPEGPAAVVPAPVAPRLAPEEELWAALRTGIAEHAGKASLHHAVVGLGGGIDSALVAALACEALGPEVVTAVLMTGADSDPGAGEDVRALCAALGCELREVRIEDVQGALDAVLAPELEGGDLERTADRVEARVRASVLMALSGHLDWLLLSTANKSELACGYSTLYGETFGGFAAIRDVPRTLVVRLAHWRQGRDPQDGPFPAGILERPHGGLRPDRWTRDGLPPFEQVDPILQAYVEDDEDPETIAARGFPLDLVHRVVGLVEAAEAKRRQAPPGIKISLRAFGRDRRMPLTHGFRAVPDPARERLALVSA